MTRSFRVLNAFDGDASELTLEQLAQLTGLARSTVHRLAGQLVTQGALERSRRGWRLGTRLFELGQRVAPPRQLREIAFPFMQDLFAATGETIQLAVADRAEVLYVEIVSGHRRAPTPSRRGGRMPLHCTALGKAMLAYSSDLRAQWSERAPTLTAFTDRTITDHRRLEEELQAIRDRQLAFDRQEAALGLHCVAAPVLDRFGVATAALSVSMPAGGRLTVAEVAPAVQTVARALSRHSPPARR